MKIQHALIVVAIMVTAIVLAITLADPNYADAAYVNRVKAIASGAYDADSLSDDVATSASAATVVNSFTAQPTYPERIIITPGGTTADVSFGVTVVVGTDYAGDALTNNLTFAANTTTPKITAQAFATVTTVTFPKQDGAGATYDIGTSGIVDIEKAFTNFSLLYSVMIIFDADPSGAADLTIGYDSPSGAAYDHTIYTIDPKDSDNDSTTLWMLTQPYYLERDGVLLIDYNNTAEITSWACEVVYSE